MSNLGGYQWITTFIKSVGGPENAKKLAIAAAGGLFVAGGAVYSGGQAAIKTIKIKLDKKAPPCATRDQLFVVEDNGKDSSGLELNVGDVYRVLECDGDAVLIEVIKDDNNPYFVSAEFLATVSKYPRDARG